MRVMLRVFVCVVVAAVSMSSNGDWTPATGKVTTADKVGIGTTNPETELHVATESSSSPRGLLLQQSINTVNSPLFIFRKSRGSIGSPAAIQNGDSLGTMYSEGHNGSAFMRTGAFLKFSATGTVTTTSIPTDLSFGTGDAGVGLERMRITSAGKVGIGLAAPLSELHVVSEATSAYRNLTIDYYSNNTNSALFTARKARGTASSPLALQSGDNIAHIYPMAYDGAQFVNPARVGFQVDGVVSSGAVPTAFQVYTGSVNGGSERLRVTSGGTVAIGAPSTINSAVTLHVNGHAQFDGTVSGSFIKAHYQDLAEWVPSNDDLAPGTVVVLDAAIGNGVMASTRAYDTGVAGVVSERPGIILGEEGASKEQVATTGRVRVKVDASLGAIAVGDLLVTSDKPGYAMRSTPIDVGGAQIHRPGTIVGKALESLRTGEGEILVLLSLQ